MVVVVKCPICNNNRKVKDRQRFFICCKVTHVVADNFICKGVDRAGKAGKKDGLNSATPQEPARQQEPKPENHNTNPGQQTDNRDRARDSIDEEPDICAHCGSKVGPYYGNYPEKCPVCGGKWR